MLGTARYASPGQVSGAPIDGKADVYSLALVLIEAVTRLLPGVIGALLVLAAAVLMRFLGWPTAWLLYPGLTLMLLASLWDLFSPPAHICAVATTPDDEHC